MCIFADPFCRPSRCDSSLLIYVASPNQSCMCVPGPRTSGSRRNQLPAFGGLLVEMTINKFVKVCLWLSKFFVEVFPFLRHAEKLLHLPRRFRYFDVHVLGFGLGLPPLGPWRMRQAQTDGWP